MRERKNFGYDLCYMMAMVLCESTFLYSSFSFFYFERSGPYLMKLMIIDEAQYLLSISSDFSFSLDL
jgi:hypothetical protein